MDIENTTTVEQSLAPVVASTDQTSAVIDLAGFRDANIIASIGASGDTLSGTVYIEMEMQESSDDVTYTACADADITNAVTGTNTGTFALIDDPAEDSAIYQSKYLGTKQYVKVVANVTGTHTNGTPLGITAVKAGENYLP